MALSRLIETETKPQCGLLALESVILAYIVLTLGMMTALCGNLQNTDVMLGGRLRIAVAILALWAAYRLWPCRLTMALRVFVQLAMLGWWYPDTYELNRSLPNLDHLFAQADQNLFHCQPALLFHEAAPWPLLSELLDYGYVSYYPMMAAVLLAYYFHRYEEFTRCALIVIGSFFLYYAIFIVLPVAGPTYYYQAIGLDNASQGVFPALGSYFDTHDDCMAVPGYVDGIGYWLVEVAKIAGERPTAAFPSSHVGVATVCMILLHRLRTRRLFAIFLPLYVSLCLATVYIQAHYAVDALAGLLSGAAFYCLLSFLSGKPSKRPHQEMT